MCGCVRGLSKLQLGLDKLGICLKSKISGSAKNSIIKINYYLEDIWRMGRPDSPSVSPWDMRGNNSGGGGLMIIVCRTKSQGLPRWSQGPEQQDSGARSVVCLPHGL